MIKSGDFFGGQIVPSDLAHKGGTYTNLVRVAFAVLSIAIIQPPTATGAITFVHQQAAVTAFNNAFSANSELIPSLSPTLQFDQTLLPYSGVTVHGQTGLGLAAK